MGKKFAYGLTVAGALMFGVGVLNTSFVGSAIAAEDEKKDGEEKEKKDGHLILSSADEEKEGEEKEKEKKGGHLILS